MADNTVMNTGAGGDTLASDDIGGVKHPRVKLEHGADGSATDVSTASPLPVDQTNTTVADGGALPAKGVQIGGTDGSVFQVMSTDNAGRPNVNVNGAVDTELPAAAALADGAANPTAPAVGGFGMLWNGTTWDRAKGDATNGAFVNVKTSVLPTGASTAAKQPALGTAGVAATDVITVQGIASGTVLPVSGTVTANLGTAAVTNAGTFVVQENGAALTALQLIDDTVFTDDAAFTVSTSKVNAIGLMADQASTDSVNEGDIGIPRMTLDRIQIVAQAPSADTAGLSTSHLVSAGSTNATVVKASAGKLHRWYIYNSNAAARKLAFHNASSAPTAGASIFFTLMIPPTSAANDSDEIGIAFSTGIAFTTVTGLADSDNAAVAANDLIINLWYI